MTKTSVISLPSSQSWLLQTRRTGYALGLNSQDIPQHTYWGAKLTALSDYSAPSSYSNASFGTARRDEFPVWGDYQFVEPCLKVHFHDGVRAGLLAFSGADVQVDQLTLTLQDPVYPLRVQLIYRVIEDCDVIVRSAAIQNTGDHFVNLDRAMSAAWHFPIRDVYVLRTLAGKWAGEFQVQDTVLPLGKQVIERRSGSSGFANNPWFALAADGATETHGEVWFGALAFSGNYKLILERTALGETMLTGGINDFDFTWRLAPGETFVTPDFVAGYTEHGYGEASRLLHRYAVEYVLPPNTAHQPRPVVYNSWYVTTFDVNVENQVGAAEIAADLGVEYFVMDDGWFGARDNDRAGLGDWYVNPRKFPDGLKPLIDRVQALGMQFGLWVEPEMVNPDSDLYRAHPDWVYHFPNRPRSEGRNQLVLNFAREDVQAHIFDVLDALLRDHDIRFIKWDMNRHFSEPGWLNAPDGRDQEIWVRHTQGVYALLRRLREKHPQVLFESCSGGGGRVDLGVMRYVEQFWMSDNTDAFDDLFIQEGFSMAYPLRTRMLWVTDNLDFNNRRPLSLQYRFHVAMMGALGIGADLSTWSEADRAQARRMIALYKDIRETVQFGALYRLRSPRESQIAAQQFIHPNGDEIVVFAFLHSTHYGTERVDLRLHGLDPSAVYAVHLDPLQDEPPQPLSGQALMKRGLHLSFRGDFLSRMILIRRIDGV
jgi:alpha-galactosidase